MSAETVFYLLGAFAVVSALLCITQRNPIASALWLVATMFALAGIYVLLNAQFIAVIQVLVYAGAVMVLFLFVIMLLNLGRDETSGDLRSAPVRFAAVLIGGALLAELLLVAKVTPGGMAVLRGVTGGAGSPLDAFPAGTAGQTASASQGVVGAIAEPLFRTYLIPFEITSVLLLAAAVGAVVLAKRKL